MKHVIFVLWIDFKLVFEIIYFTIPFYMEYLQYQLMTNKHSFLDQFFIPYKFK